MQSELLQRLNNQGINSHWGGGVQSKKMDRYKELGWGHCKRTPPPPPPPPHGVHLPPNKLKVHFLHSTPLIVLEAMQTTPSQTKPTTTLEPEPQKPTSPRAKGICPDECTCYDDFQTVICRRFLLSVPQDLPIETRQLILNDNQISRIRKYDFYDLVNLEVLHLHNNKIQKIDDGSFEDLCNLEKLFLLNNEITSITQSTFNGLGNLTTLWLSNLNSDKAVISIQDGSFEKLERLEYLILNGNKFIALTDRTFKGLSRLSLLSISFHLVKVISAKAFDILPRNVSIQTDPYDIELCCCSSAIALNDSRIYTSSLKTRCTESACTKDNNAHNVCKMKFASTSSNYTDLNHFSSIAIQSASIPPFFASIGSTISQLRTNELSTYVTLQPTSSIQDVAIHANTSKPKRDEFSTGVAENNWNVYPAVYQGKDEDHSQVFYKNKLLPSLSMSRDSSIPSANTSDLSKTVSPTKSIKTVVEASHLVNVSQLKTNSSGVKRPVKMVIDWGSDKNSATSLKNSAIFLLVLVMKLHYLF